jgi:hypothetical protein
MKNTRTQKVLLNKFVSNLIFASLLVGFIAILNLETNAQRGMKVVKTKIPVAYKGRIAVSDSIISFGTGFTTGVEYIKPGDVSARKIPNGDRFSSKFFAVAGDKIILADPNAYTISVFDTATQKMTDISESTLKLKLIMGDMQKGGSIQSSGNYAVVITDTSGDDDSALKVIDVSGAEPKVIRFDGSGMPNSNQEIFKQAAIDANSGFVAGGGGVERVLKVFNFKKPDADVKEFDLEQYRGVGEAQMKFDDGKILFQTGEAYPRALILDVTTGKITELSKAIFGMALSGGKYVYFASRDAKDKSSINARAAVGTVGTQPKFSDGETPIGGSTSNGVVGFGSSAAITPDGKHIFIAGAETVGRTERLQNFAGGKFSAMADSSVKPAFLQASDVVASNSIIAFKVGSDNNTTLGYIKLK